MSLQSPDSPSFLQRCNYWHDALDPALLLSSNAEIKNRKDLLGTHGESNEEKVAASRRLVQVSVHPDTGTTTPFLFRPTDPRYGSLRSNRRWPADIAATGHTHGLWCHVCYHYILHEASYTYGDSCNRADLLRFNYAGWAIVPTLMPHQGVMSTFISQLFFQAYSAGFTVMNRNLTGKEKTSLSQHPLYLSGSVLNVACFGAMPLYVVKRLKLSGPSTKSFIGRILPPPLLALLGGLNVLLVRICEVDSGIQVVDRAGNVVGVSPKAGKKAVKETALSRAFLCGVTALTPSLVRSSPQMYRNPGVFTVVKLLIAVLTFGIMTPISFALFPQQGKIKRDNLEDELKEKTSASELFYHRGL